MRKEDLEVGVDYAYQEPGYGWSRDEFWPVTLVELLKGSNARVRDKDGEFDVTTRSLVKPWTELGRKDKQAPFRTSEQAREDRQRHAREADPEGYDMEQIFNRFAPHQPGKGGTPRVSERLPVQLRGLSEGISKMRFEGIVGEEQWACWKLLRELLEVCERISNKVEAYGLLEALEAESREGRLGTAWQHLVRQRVEEGQLPFSSAEIMPVSSYGDMNRDRDSTAYRTNSPAAGDFMLLVADDYEELDRLAYLGQMWAWGFYLRWRNRHQEEIRGRVVVQRTSRRR